MRKIAVLAFALGLVFSGAIRAQDGLPPVDEIIRKHIDARGGLEKIRAIQTLKITGTALLGGQLEAPITVRTKRPNLVRLDMVLQGKGFIQSYDGDTAWTVNPMQGNPEAQKAGADEQKQMESDADIDGVLVDYKAKGHKVQLVGKADIETGPAYNLKITKKNGVVENQFLDISTFLEMKSSTSRAQMGQSFEVETLPSDYKPVNGVMEPFTMVQKANGNVVMSMKVEKIEANTAIDSALFAMPAAPVKKDESKP